MILTTFKVNDSIHVYMIIIQKMQKKSFTHSKNTFPNLQHFKGKKACELQDGTKMNSQTRIQNKSICTNKKKRSVSAN
jgi:hypothetical protein